MIGYLRVPKTGSTALAHALITQRGGDVCRGVNHWVASSFIGHNHGHEWATMIRNPMQVSVSYFYFLQRRLAEGRSNPLMHDPQNKGNLMLMAREATVEEWLDESPANQAFSYYYEDLDPSTFMFVGNCDDMERSNRLAKAVLGLSIPDEPANVNDIKRVEEQYDPCYSELDFMNRNAADYDAYYAARDRYYQLLQEYEVM